MALQAITDEQRIALRQDSRFTGLVKNAIKNYSKELILMDGTAGAGLDGNTLTPVKWAKYRYVAKGIILNPNSQDWETWLDQFIIAIAAVIIWESTSVDVPTGVQSAINTIIAAGNAGFRAYVKFVFDTRIDNFPF
jgi:hypothetical protein